MSTWNLRLGRTKIVIRVKAILKRQPSFIIILDQEGKEHKLSEADFSSSEWRKIKVGTEIEIIIQESIEDAKVRSVALPKVFEKKEVPIPGYLSYCEICGKIRTFGIEEGDSPWRVLENIHQAHATDSPQCDGIKLSRFRIYDHNGVEKIGAVSIMMAAEKE